MAKVVPVGMIDSVSWELIPANAQVVAGYVDSDFAWPAEAWARWPGAQKVLISAIPGSPQSRFANVADCERGDYTPASVRDWIGQQQADGRKGNTAYVGLEGWQGLEVACRGLMYFPWVADWTGTAHQLPGACAVQFANHQGWDSSMVYSQVWLDLLQIANEPWPL